MNTVLTLIEYLNILAFFENAVSSLHSMSLHENY